MCGQQGDTSRPDYFVVSLLCSAGVAAVNSAWWIRDLWKALNAANCAGVPCVWCAYGLSSKGSPASGILWGGAYA